MREKVVLTASFGASSQADGSSSPSRSDIDKPPSAASTERTVLMFLGGLLGGLMVLSLGFVAVVSYAGFHAETASQPRSASPD